MNQGISNASETNYRLTETTTTPPPRLSQAASSPIVLPHRGGKSVSTKNLTANIVADLVIEFCSEHGDIVTNLKLQRLLYYAQAWHLALYDTALFRERFEAWRNGPIQPDVYVRFSSIGSRMIEEQKSNWKVPKKITKHIQDVMEAYVHLSAFDLERLSCDEEPWRKARNGLPPEEPSTAEISVESMRKFYKSRLNEQKKR